MLAWTYTKVTVELVLLVPSNIIEGSWRDHRDRRDCKGHHDRWHDPHLPVQWKSDKVKRLKSLKKSLKGNPKYMQLFCRAYKIFNKTILETETIERPVAMTQMNGDFCSWYLILFCNKNVFWVTTHKVQMRKMESIANTKMSPDKLLGKIQESWLNLLNYKLNIKTNIFYVIFFIDCIFICYIWKHYL